MKSRICGICGKEWTPSNTGEAKRKDCCCNSCYPLYRKAVLLYHAALYRATQQSLPFSITIKDVYERLQHPCPRTGVQFVIDGSGRNYRDRHPYAPSIDKIKAELGYTPENIQVVCWWYNLSKALFTDEEVYNLCQKVVSLSDTGLVLPVTPLTI